MMFAYQENPESFVAPMMQPEIREPTAFPTSGRNQVGTGLAEQDESCSGRDDNQIADDRDHAGMRLPNKTW